MKQKFGLGKGLEALIPDEEEDINDSIRKVPMNLIKANEKQPRKNFDEEKILQLANSIKQHGVIQPIILRKEDDYYIIVAGERRWRAAKLAQIKEIPAIIMELTSNQVLEISLIENIQREDLNPIEEALAYKKLIEELNLTQEKLADRIGKSRVAVTNTMRLLNLDKRIYEYIIDGLISEGHGRALLSIENKDKQYEIAQYIIDNQLNVRDTEKLIKNLGVRREKQSKNNVMNPYIIDIKNRLENRFGTKVIINNKKNKGKIEIEYYSTDDLNRILDLMEVK